MHITNQEKLLYDSMKKTNLLSVERSVVAREGGGRVFLEQ